MFGLVVVSFGVVVGFLLLIVFVLCYVLLVYIIVFFGLLLLSIVVFGVLCGGDWLCLVFWLFLLLGSVCVVGYVVCNGIEVFL